MSEALGEGEEMRRSAPKALSEPPWKWENGKGKGREGKGREGRKGREDEIDLVSHS